MEKEIKNKFIRAIVNTSGAQICSLISNSTEKEYIWETDSKIRANIAVK